MAKYSAAVLAVMLGLKDKGITSLTINFSGSGDSGDIDDLDLYINDESLWRGNHGNVSDYLSSDQIELIKGESYQFIDESIEYMDWVNNDGGYGHIKIDLESMTANVNYYERTVDEYSWSDLSLFEE